MTRTEGRLALVERQRRYAWGLARHDATAAAATLVAGRTHDLLNFLQIAQLTAEELARRLGGDPDNLVADLRGCGATARVQLTEMMALARPRVVIAAGAPIGPVVSAALADLRAAGLAVTVTDDAPATLTTRCDADALTALIIGLALAATDAADAPAALDLVIRARPLDGKPHLELVCGSPVSPDAPPFDLGAVERIATAHGGELAHSDRRGGGSEWIVALPIID